MPEPTAQTETPNKGVQASPSGESSPSSSGTGTAGPSSRTYTEAEYTSLKSERDEFERLTRNAAAFIETDPDVRDRLGLYNKSFTEKKPYQDLIREWEATKKNQAQPAKTDSASMAPSQQQIQEMIRREMEGATRPFVDAQAKTMLKETQESIRKDNPWVTEKDMDTFGQRFNDLCARKADQIFQANYPRMTKDQAWNQAVGSFVEVDDNILFDSLMKAEREESILGKRRTAPKLPAEMADTMTVGKDPDLLDKVKKAYASMEGDGEKVAQLLKEYAPQFGIDVNDRNAVSKFYSLVTK